MPVANGVRGAPRIEAPELENIARHREAGLSPLQAAGALVVQGNTVSRVSSGPPLGFAYTGQPVFGADGRMTRHFFFPFVFGDGFSAFSEEISSPLAAIKDWTFLLGPGWVVGWGNGLILGYMMYRTQLVPRPWPWLGLIGGPLLIISGIAIGVAVWSSAYTSRRPRT